MWEKVVKELFKNTPLAFVVMGVFLVLLGATGGFERIGINIEGLGWRIVLAVIGLVVAGFGCLVVWRGQIDFKPSALAKKCGPKITSPRNNSVVREKIHLEGTYKKKPPDGSLAIIEKNPSNARYWFKEQAPVFRENEKQWFTDIYIGGDKDEERLLYLAILGESGKALLRYFLSVPEQCGKNNWAGVEELTPDIVLCDQVSVHYK